MRPKLKTSCLLGLSLLLWSPWALAQESTSDAPPATSAESADSTEEADRQSPRPWETQQSNRTAAPDVYFLPDGVGKLRKVLGFRYEDFLKAWQHDKGPTQVRRPRFVIDTWNVSGKVNETQADLRVEIEITLHASGWVDIPIQLPKFIVQQLTIADQSEGECLVYDGQRHGHVIWLAAESGSKRKVVLDGLAKLTINADREAMELYLPRATTSKFSLLVPDSFERLEASPELSVATVAAESGFAEVKLLGQANPVQLSWRTASETTPGQATLVEVDGQTTVRVDRGRITYVATLQANSFGKPLDRLRVQLPPGAKLNSTNTSQEYQIVELARSSGADDQQLIEILATTPRAEPWEVQLAAERPLQSFSGAAECEVGGFDVLDAFAQSGTITLEVDDSLQAYTDIHGDLDQIPLRESDAPQNGTTVLGRYRYSRFPWQLAVHTSQRQRRVTVKPQYSLKMDADETRLDVQYDYELTGAKIFSLRLNLQGWQLTDSPIDAEGLIDTDRLVETREGQLVMPLLDSNIQQLKLNLSLRKKSELGENTFYLPEPLGALIVDGQLAIESARSLQVTPIFDQMTGLGVVSNSKLSSSPMESTSRKQTTEELLLRTFLPKPKFVADIRQREREVSAGSQMLVEIDQSLTRVRQQIEYLVKYRPISNLVLSLPEQLSTNSSLEISVDGTPVPYQGQTAGDYESFSQNDSAHAANESQQELVVVSLPRQMQNQIPIEISYEIPTPELKEDELTPIQLHLAVPSDVGEIYHKATVVTVQRVLATLDQRSENGTWNVVADESSAENSDASLQLQTSDNLLGLPLYLQVDSARNQKLATLERAWFQTWIAQDQRQERAAFRFRTDHDEVLVKLPAAIGDADIEVLLDGVPQLFESVFDDSISISLPDTVQPSAHTLELRYQTKFESQSWGRITASLPRLGCQEASTPVYWQLILPRNLQVLTSPDQLIPDYWLGWKNYRWGRQPNVSQADLEQSTGAAPLPPPPALSSQYVYRAFTAPEVVTCIVVRRAWPLFVGTLLVFGIGLVANYSSIARNGVFWFALSLMCLVGVFSYPEVTLLTIQVILLGGVMIFLTSVLNRVLNPFAYPSRPVPNHVSDPTTQLTEPWQGQPVHDSGNPESTATLHTGGRS